ncbi:hypothetical protein MA16_Dca006099 [Dendrobium catenatum]|uniref:Uncharacterized protein n=1 Tax=Dendrobium catenatum TaxID=906689 RepID=A0A2I0X4H9_9ASPA|nr:hypothetical protein MA16_Dca006099 [Dendrobium catenatum]
MVTSKKWNLKICLFFALNVKCISMMLMNVLSCTFNFIKIKRCPNNLNVIMVPLLRMIIFLLTRLKEMPCWVMLRYLCLVTLPQFIPHPFIPIWSLPLWIILPVCKSMLFVHCVESIMFVITRRTKGSTILFLLILLALNCLLWIVY